MIPKRDLYDFFSLDYLKAFVIQIHLQMTQLLQEMGWPKVFACPLHISGPFSLFLVGLLKYMHLPKISKN